MESKPKVLYLSPYDIQRPRTNQLSDMHFCEGFAQNGCDVNLVVPTVYRNDNVPKNEIFEHYGVDTPFSIKYLFTPIKDEVSGVVNMAIIDLYTCFIFLLNSLKPKSKKRVVISRSTAILTPIVFLKKITPFLKHPKVVLWVHEIDTAKRRLVWLYNNVDHIMSTNSKMKSDLISKVGIDESKIHVTLNPITSGHSKEELTQAEARSHIGYKGSAPLVVYTGKLFAGQKEVDFIIESAKNLREYHFLLTGGKPHAVAHYQSFCATHKMTNVTFTGYLPNHTHIKYYQFAADVLVSYYTTSEHLVAYNFPQKIVEYMLTGKPIVTPDFEAARDVLNSENAVFVEPENARSLTSGIRQAIEDVDSVEKGERARDLAKTCTFTYRTRLIMEYLAKNE